LDADLNIPKFHFRFHCVEQIWCYGAMQQYCAERYEQPHKMNIRAGCKASNHNLNYLPQVVTVQWHILCFPFREINLEAIV
jgi:hypothetical protein